MSAAFRTKLAAGEPVIVVNPDHPSASLVERLGRLPVDAVFIDCEQGSADVETVEHMARAARLAGLTSLLRLFTKDDWAIERYMGRGVDGIVVPRLERAEEAHAVVEAVRYCYPRSFSDKIVIVQVETRAALEALDAFLAVDGIDVLFLGPVDLSKSLGHAGDYRGDAMQRALAEAVAQIARRGRAAGMLVDHTDAADWVRRGARFLYTHADGFLAAGAGSFRATLAAATAEPSHS